jgi:transposase
MRELSVAEQRYQAVLAVISDGLSVSQVAQKVGVSRQTLHSWLARYEEAALDGLSDRSHRPASCPHRMPARVEAALLELGRSRPYWGPKRLVFELAKRKVSPLPSESAAYRALVRAQMIDPNLRDRRSRKWKRWERGVAMELWQMDVVGGFPLADGTSAKALTGVDDHSRMCVCARLMVRERTRAVCDGLRAALARYGAPEQTLTDNGKGVHGSVQPSSGRSALRRNLPGERHRAPVDPAPQSDHDGQDRAFPSQYACGVPQWQRCIHESEGCAAGA